MDAATKWLRQVEPHFGFLRERGFATVDLDPQPSFWGVWVTYRSATGAVRVTMSREFDRAEVNLIRLVDATVPPYPIWITSDRIDWVLLDNVLEARAPDLLTGRSHGLQSAELDSQLAFWAHALRRWAHDFIDGGFGPIDDGARVVRARVAAQPHEIQVWLPDSAPAGADAAEVERARNDVPPEVGVKIRRYGRGRS